MPEFIRRRLIHFTTGEPTEGGRIRDFVAMRQRRTGKMQAVMKVCFLIEAAAAAASMISGFFCPVGVIIMTIIGSLLFIAVALSAFGGGNIHRSIAYLLGLVYAVVCFVMGAFVCGVFQLIGTAAALVTLITGWLREYLLEYSPRHLTKNDYFYTGALLRTETPISAPPPPPPKKSELEEVAEKFKMVMNGSKP